MKTEISQLYNQLQKETQKVHQSARKQLPERKRLLSETTADSSDDVSTDFSLDSMPFFPKNSGNANYKLALCQSYHRAPYHCQYGDKCQFAHLQRNIQSTSYIELLEENSY